MIWRDTQAAVIDVINGVKGAAAAMDEIAPIIQGRLDDVFKQ